MPGKGFPPEETSNVTVRDHDNGTIAHFGGSILAKRNISETNTRGWKPVVHARDQFIVVPQVIGMESGNMRRPKISNLPTIIITNDNSSPVKTGRRTRKVIYLRILLLFTSVVAIHRIQQQSNFLGALSLQYLQERRQVLPLLVSVGKKQDHYH